ncbi:hypothetical protein HDU79_005959, partial [Rhizoclosmatium sp. JEL0117]
AIIEEFIRTSDSFINIVNCNTKDILRKVDIRSDQALDIVRSNLQHALKIIDKNGNILSVAVDNLVIAVQKGVDVAEKGVAVADKGVNALREVGNKLSNVLYVICHDMTMMAYALGCLVIYSTVFLKFLDRTGSIEDTVRCLGTLFAIHVSCLTSALVLLGVTNFGIIKPLVGVLNFETVKPLPHQPTEQVIPSWVVLEKVQILCKAYCRHELKTLENVPEEILKDFVVNGPNFTGDLESAESAWVIGSTRLTKEQFDTLYFGLSKPC